MNNILFFFVGIFFLCACQKSLDAREYLKWVNAEEHGLKKVRTIAGYKFEALYKPTEYIALMEYGISIRKDQLAERITQLDSIEYIDLKIASPSGDLLREGVSSMDEFSQRQHYFSFGFAKDIKLISNGKALPCVLFHFEKTYDLNASKVFVLGFERTGNDSDKTLRIDSPYLNTGVVNIKFDKEDLKGIPSLNIAQ